MNAQIRFANRAILFVETQDTFVVFKTWDAKHEYSRHIYLRLNALKGWLWEEDADIYEERDLHSSVRFYRSNELLSVELTSISEDNGELKGFIHRFNIDPSWLYDALSNKYTDSKLLITTREINTQARIVLPRSTHAYLRDTVLKDKQLRRAFIKAISHNFFYGRQSTVTLYPDYDGFCFGETIGEKRGLFGGLIISKYQINGHNAVAYHVHT